MFKEGTYVTKVKAYLPETCKQTVMSIICCDCNLATERSELLCISTSHLRLIETLCHYITRLLLSPLLVLASQFTRSLVDRFQNSLKLLQKPIHFLLRTHRYP